MLSSSSEAIATFRLPKGGGCPLAVADPEEEVCITRFGYTTHLQGVFNCLVPWRDCRTKRKRFTSRLSPLNKLLNFGFIKHNLIRRRRRKQSSESVQSQIMCSYGR